MAKLILKAANIDQTAAWYVAAGFSVSGRNTDDTTDWCEVTRGQTVIQFLAGDTPWAGAPSMTGCVYVAVDDIEAALLALTEPARSEWGIERRPWDASEIVLRDPDGYFITLTARSN